ncbi:MAG: Ig-like domain repeat protein [Acidobacteria bacterium]|nr:Ig-like domain repeat protein [Acidobacteriota bacterium]
MKIRFVVLIAGLLGNGLAAMAMQNALQPTTTSLSVAATSVLLGAADAVTITVAPLSFSVTVPTGTVAVSIDGASPGSPITLSNGSATYNFSSSIVGSHSLTVYYSGDSNYQASTGTATIEVVQKGFAISATGITVSAGQQGQSTITVTPENGYTGTIAFSISSNSTSFSIPCFSVPNATVTGTQPVNVTLTINTTPSGCPAARTPSRGDTLFASSIPRGSRGAGSGPGSWAGVAALLPLMALIGRRRFWGISLAAVLAMVCFGCAGSSSTTVPKGTYVITVSGADKAANIASTTVLSLTVD